MLSLLITLVIVGLIFAIIWWGITQIPMPAPFATVVRVVFVIAVVIVLVSFLTNGLGGIGHIGSPGWRGL